MKGSAQLQRENGLLGTQLSTSLYFWYLTFLDAGYTRVLSRLPHSVSRRKQEQNCLTRRDKARTKETRVYSSIVPEHRPTYCHK